MTGESRPLGGAALRCKRRSAAIELDRVIETSGGAGVSSPCRCHGGGRSRRNLPTDALVSGARSSPSSARGLFPTLRSRNGCALGAVATNVQCPNLPGAVQWRSKPNVPHALPGMMTDTSRWWAKKRLTYNVCLALAGLGAFACYAVVGETAVPIIRISKSQHSQQPFRPSATWWRWRSPMYFTD